MEITAYFRDVVKQDAQKLKNYFAKDAKVLWHNTNECFTAEEFIRAEYMIEEMQRLLDL